MQFHPDLYSKSISSEELILRGLGKVNDVENIHFDFIAIEKKYSEEEKEIIKELFPPDKIFMKEEEM